MLIGVLASFLGATFQASNYVLTQSCQQNYRVDGVRLLVAAHVVMGVIALLFTVVFGYWQYFHLSQLGTLVLINLPYLLAQFFLVKAIKHSDASIVSPLLALKIPVLAAISIMVFEQHFAANQFMAMSLIVAAALYFSRLSGSLMVKPMMFVLLASVGYCLSDIAITDFSKTIAEIPAYEQTMVSIAINYLFCGVLAVSLMTFTKVTPKMVYQAKWVGLAWYVAVLFLILGFSLSGVVSGNIVQSLRGVIGVLLAFLFFRHQLNQPQQLWRKKLLGSLFMFAAVGLFYL